MVVMPRELTPAVEMPEATSDMTSRVVRRMPPRQRTQITQRRQPGTAALAHHQARCGADELVSLPRVATTQ